MSPRRFRILAALAVIPGAFLGSALGDVVADLSPVVETVAVAEPVAEPVEVIHIVPLSPVPLPFCAEEDDESRPCYWDASRQGNGEGESFISLSGGRHYYSDLDLVILPEYAHARMATIAGVSYIVA